MDSTEISIKGNGGNLRRESFSSGHGEPNDPRNTMEGQQSHSNRRISARGGGVHKSGGGPASASLRSSIKDLVYRDQRPVEGRAEPDTDEVFAQVTLLPDPNQDESAVDKEAPPTPPPLFHVHSFCKTLTASDTSTHGLSRQPPTQELVAKDLHGNEWRFRHIFRGQPRRHLLQSGWSVFVSSKRLVAGDAFIFLRGENGELRVGVRRAMRQQGNVPSSVISSHSMHLGVLATAWHAISTGTMFTVYYKPRYVVYFIHCTMHRQAQLSSLFQLIDTWSLSRTISIGMRFKMRFEGEEAPEQRFTGTIVGIEDADPKRWRESKWRCLKVRWDETSTIPRPERVSTWSIEPSLAPPAMSPLPAPRPKRPRSNMFPSSPDSSVLTREGSSKVTVDPHLSSGYSRVLQVWPSSIDDEKIDVVSASRRQIRELHAASGWQKPTYTDLLSGFGAHANSSHGFGEPFVDQTATAASRKLVLDQEGKFNYHPSPWSLMSSGLSLKLSESNSKVPVKGCDISFEARGNVKCSAFNEYPKLNGRRVEQSHGNWLMPLPPPSHFDSHAHARELAPKPILVQEKRLGNPQMESSDQLHVLDSDQRLEHSKFSKMTDDNEQEKQSQAGLLHSRDNQGKFQNASTRSCTKVHKQGIALGRSVDLTKFNNYNELIAELDRLFEFDGELMAPKRIG
ncbi:hypothetical protein GH714_024615 [Hevea brasiliensis]|uniref:Auxin response factor n=1 Tax=Hevea brasiliensis TaxID=3981 RepID=A0A6A6ME58_HEVBR|nr:hypothetical protein GH714_024615 [Hevea brasiliensis]